MNDRYESRLDGHASPAAEMRSRVVVHGFTLIELMVTISIAAILATIAIPSFQDATLNSKLNALSNNFVASAHLARSEAIKRNATVTLSAASGGWQNGWEVKAGTTVIHTQSNLPNGFLLSEGNSVSSIVFQPTGVGANSASLTLCRVTPTVGSQKRTISVSVTGRPDVTKVTGATTCP